MCLRVMPNDGINTATAIMLAINLSILYRETGTTTCMCRIITVRAITPVDNTMTQAGSTMTMTRTTVHTDTMNLIDILMKPIKTDATTATITGMAMTNTEANRIKGTMAKKNRIGAIEGINGV